MLQNILPWICLTHMSDTLSFEHSHVKSSSVLITLYFEHSKIKTPIRYVWIVKLPIVFEERQMFEQEFTS